MFLSCLSFCKSVLNFNLANNYWTVKARALIFHMSILSMGTNIFYVVTLTLESGLLFEYYNPVNNIWIVSARALICNMNIPCDTCKIFLLVLNRLTFTFDQFFKKLISFSYVNFIEIILNHPQQVVLGVKFNHIVSPNRWSYTLS